MKTWVKGAILGVFILSYPFTYLLGSSSKDKEWAAKFSQMAGQYTQKVEELEVKHRERESTFQASLSALTEQSKTDYENYQLELNRLAMSHSDSVRKSSERADIYRKQARSSEAERENLANHCSRLDQALVEGKTVARELRYTLEQREHELRELGTVLKSIEKKYE